MARVITERIKPILTGIIGTEQQGFIQGGGITGNLILVKEIIAYCNENNIEAYIIMMDFQKSYNQIDQVTMLETLEKINIGPRIIELVKLLYIDSSAIIVINSEKGPRFRTEGGFRQGCPLRPYLFIIVLELMAIEMRDDGQIIGVNPLSLGERKITSHSNHNNQIDNIEDRLSMFANDSSTIITKSSQLRPARENIHSYEKASNSKLYESRTIIIKLGKARRMTISKETFNVNFSIMNNNYDEQYLGDVIGNKVTIQTFDKHIPGIEKLGNLWIKANRYVKRRTIVKTILIAEISHKASVNGISKDMKTKILIKPENSSGVVQTRKRELTRCIFHFECCNVDHNRKRRINHQVILLKTIKQMSTVINNFETIKIQASEMSKHLNHTKGNNQTS